MVIISNTVIMDHAGRVEPRSETSPAIRAAPPVTSRASPTGIMAPRRIMTGQSIAL